MAKGFFNTLTSSESADSAGIKPETCIDPNTIKAMMEVGIDVSYYVPKKLTFEMNNQFDIFVILGCGTNHPFTPRQKTIEWSIDDPKGKSLDNYRVVRDTIKNHIEKLITRIEKN